MAAEVKQIGLFRSFWLDSLANSFWFVLERWNEQFDTADDARLVGRSISRECHRSDIAPDIWFDFFRELVSVSRPADAFEAIANILDGPLAQKFFLPGMPIPWSGFVYHYERLDRLNEQSLRFPIGDDRLLENLADSIETGSCGGRQLEGRPLGRPTRPYWVTDDALIRETESDTVRNRLGLRSVNQPGYRLAEIRYPSAYLTAKSVQVKAPTVLDAWQDGARRSWIFTKAAKQSSVPTAGHTIDLSLAPNGGLGPREAVHAPLFVPPGDGFQFDLRVLRPITGAPPELSLVGLFMNGSI